MEVVISFYIDQPSAVGGVGGGGGGVVRMLLLLLLWVLMLIVYIADGHSTSSNSCITAIGDDDV